jgi:hypothetical protein
MITSVRVIWLVNEAKKKKEEARYLYISRAREKERNAVAMSEYSERTMMDERRRKKNTATSISRKFSISLPVRFFQTLNYTLLISFYLLER